MSDAPGDLWRSPFAIPQRRPEAGVRQFREQLALARRGGRLASMAIVGDSITEGFEASKRGYRWTDLAARRLAGEALGIGTYVPASCSTFASTTTAGDWPGNERPWTYSGTTAGSVAYGASLHAATITNGYMELPYFGDVVTLHYVRTPEADEDGYTVTIDGASAGTLSANGTLLPGQAATFGTVGDYGYHVVRVTVGSGAGTLTLEGASVADSIRYGFGVGFDAVRVVALGHAGFAAQHFVDTPTWASSVVAQGAQCVGIALGLNDTNLAAGAGGTPAEYRDNLVTMMELVDAAYDAVSLDLPGFLLVEMPSLPDAWVEAAWNAAERHDVRRASVLDLARLASFTSGWGAFEDASHPNDGGQQWLADRLVELVDPLCPPLPSRRRKAEVVVSAADLPESRLAWTAAVAGAASSGDGSRTRVSDTSGGGTTVGERRHRVWLEPGTYQGIVEVRRNASQGTIEVLVGGTSLGTYATADASASSIAQALGTTVTITTPGWYPVTIRKTSASGAIVFTELHLRRTA